MIAVLASGPGSNFEALAQYFKGQIQVLICNVEKAKVLELAKQYEIPSLLIPHKNFKTRGGHEIEIIENLKKFPQIKIVVLAGYMRVLSPTFFQYFRGMDPAVSPKGSPRDDNKNNAIKIINLHPAHLDEYKGAHAFEFAVENKFPRWGISVHKVTEELDSGELLNSVEFPIYPYETVAHLKQRTKVYEHQILIQTVEELLQPPTEVGGIEFGTRVEKQPGPEGPGFLPIVKKEK